MELQSRAFLEEIGRASSVLIGTHVNPDGDALGSALAMGFFLEDRGVDFEIVCQHAPPENLKFLPHVDRIRTSPERSDHDLGIIVDLDSPKRLGQLGAALEACPRLIVIDHHVPHESPGDLRIIDESAAATAAILTRLFLELDAPISASMATCLLTGIVTDTGSFRFRNTNAEALELAGKLLECGGNINLVSEEVFQRKALASMRLLGLLLERMSLDMDERLVWGILGHDAFAWAQAKDEDTEGFVNELLSIRTAQVAALFREPNPGRVNVSIRSRGDLDVSAVAREFGGGGHRNAAGCTFTEPIDVVVERMLPRLRACLASS